MLEKIARRNRVLRYYTDNGVTLALSRCAFFNTSKVYSSNRNRLVLKHPIQVVHLETRSLSLKNDSSISHLDRRYNTTDAVLIPKSSLGVHGFHPCARKSHLCLSPFGEATLVIMYAIGCTLLVIASFQKFFGGYLARLLHMKPDQRPTGAPSSNYCASKIFTIKQPRPSLKPQWTPRVYHPPLVKITYSSNPQSSSFKAQPKNTEVLEGNTPSNNPRALSNAASQVVPPAKENIPLQIER